MREVYITNHHIISSLGIGSNTNFQNLINEKSGIKMHSDKDGNFCFSSKVDEDKIKLEFERIGESEEYTLLEKMMIISINHIIKNSKIKITEKTGLIIATTKGNIEEISINSKFDKNSKREYLYSLGKQIKDFFNFSNEAVILSNACVSGILGIEVAKRLIQSNFYDEVIVVGGDLVSDFILAGFNSFQAISDQPCKPFSINRTGITIGEAVASALVTSDKEKTKKGAVQIIGGASCNDANHISGPSRTGEGLYLSVKSAMREAEINANDVDYISAHGTATNFNDEMESIAFDRLDMLDVPLNSLKGFYGHTLGASGILETIIGIKSMENNILISSLGFDELGVSKKINVIKETKNKQINIFLKTASGFGGCNTAVLFKKVKEAVKY